MLARRWVGGRTTWETECQSDARYVISGTGKDKTLTRQKGLSATYITEGKDLKKLKAIAQHDADIMESDVFIYKNPTEDSRVPANRALGIKNKTAMSAALKAAEKLSEYEKQILRNWI